MVNLESILFVCLSSVEMDYIESQNVRNFKNLVSLLVAFLKMCYFY